MNIRIGSSPQPQWAHLQFWSPKRPRCGACFPSRTPPGLNPSGGAANQGHPQIPRIPVQMHPPPGFISFQTRPIQDLSAPFLGGRVIFFLDKRSSEESRTYLLLLKLRTKGSKKMLLQLGLAILFCYEKVVLSLPLLHPNPCLDIRVLSP